MNILRTVFFALAALASTARGATVDATFATASTVPVTAEGYSATGNEVNLTLGFAPPTGTSLTVVRSTGLAFIDGRFSNLAQGQIVRISYNGVSYPFVANYYGGTGNDLVLVWAYQSPVAWGSNFSSELGNGSAANSSTPVAVTTTGVLAGKTVVAVAAGYEFSLALCADGTVATWGSNTFGQLGNGSTNYRNTPAAVITTGVLAGKTVVAVAAAHYHSLALCSDGTVAAWGYNAVGELGNGNTTDSNVPVAVTTTGALAGKTVVAIAAGQYHSLALCADGSVVAWGYNNSGQLGDGSTTNSSVPVAVTATGVLAGKTVVAVAAGDSHSLAVCADGTVAGWGSNSQGRLGDGKLTGSSEPVAMTATGVLAGKTVTAVAAGQFHSLVLCADGTLAACGYNNYGQLGNGSTTSSSVPAAVTTTGVLVDRVVTAIAADSSYNLALCADGTVAAWGYNAYGQFGNGSSANSSVPVAVTATGVLAGKAVTAVAAGNTHALALAASPLSANAGLASVTVGGGTSAPVFVSGAASYGACVSKDTSSITVTPTVSDPGAVVEVNGVLVASGTASSAIALSPGVNTVTLVVRPEDRALFKTHTLSVLRPEPLNATFNAPDAPALTFPAYDATGLSVLYALNFKPETGCQLTLVRNTGPAFITGSFDNLAQGQFVRLSYDGVSYPFIANYYGGTGNDLVLVWAYQSPAAWGDNNNGQLGDGSTIKSSTPVAVTATGVLAGKTVVAAAAGNSHSLALCSDGTVAAWGYNNYGQLGNGSTIKSSTPVAVTATGVLAGKTVVAAAAGNSHSLALCSDGTVAAWGYNASGQLGNGSTTQSSEPVTVTATGALAGRTVVAVAAGSSHSLALCADGTVAAWGHNNDGQLGNGNTINSSTPVAVPATGVLAGKTVVAVAAGVSQSFALCTDGTVAAWGYNAYGELGDGSGAYNSSTPLAVASTGVLAGKAVIAVAAGDSHCLALCSDGTLGAWGRNSSGQLGNGTTSSFSSTPIPATTTGVLAGKTVVAMAAGGSHSFTLCSDGTLVAWGSNSYGQLGNGGTSNSSTPVAVPATGVLAGTTVTAVTAGYSHTVALAALPLSADAGLASVAVNGGTIIPAYASGAASYGACVSKDTGSITVTPTVSEPNALVEVNGTLVASGTASPAIALTPGINAITLRVTPEDRVTVKTYTLSVLRPEPLNVTFDAPDSPAFTFPAYDASELTVQYALNFKPETGAQLTLVNNTGPAFITGRFDNLSQGQIVRIPFDGVNYPFVANYFGGTGNDLVLVWAYQRPVAWGYNDSGQLGNGDTASSSTPVAVIASGVLAGKTVTTVSAGGYHNLAVCADGTVAAWGHNTYGQLGDGTTANSSTPVTVPPTGALDGKTVVALAAGDYHSLALCADGTLAAWGRNHYGQIGDGTTTNTSTPVAVSATGVLAGKTVVAITPGGYHNLALCSDGTVAAWGLNSNGQLGNNSTTNSSMPVVVSTTGGLAGKTVVAVAAGNAHSLALCSDGTVAAWGSNSSGVLGNGSTVSSSVPVAVTTTGLLAGRSVVAIAAGSAHSLALCADGTVAAWGINTNGQLGNGSTTASNVPIAVTTTGLLAGKTVTTVAAGAAHSLALCADGTVAAWGLNAYRQLGNGGTTSSSVPVAVTATGVLAGRATVAVAGGYSHSLALAALPLATDAGLAGITVNSGTTIPAYASGTATFGACVATDTNSITVTPTVSDPNAAVEVNGMAVANGAASTAIALVPGINDITLVVRAEDRAVVRTYTLSVLRPEPLNAVLNAPDAPGLTFPAYDATGLSVQIQLNFKPATGTQLTLIRNTGSGQITGRFSNLAQGQLVRISHNGVSYPFVANYYGGTGNDLVLVWAYQSMAAWGYNIYGQLGNGGTASSGTPVPVSAAGVLEGRTVVAAAAGQYHTVALCTDGTMAAWGYNTFSQLGNGGTTSSSTPVAVTATGVLAGKTVVAVAAGGSHSLALCADGTVATWGSNSDGQLGNGTTTNSSAPVAVTATGVLAGKMVVAVAAGQYHSLALCADGTLAAWGSNSSAQLGSSGTLSSSTPVAVPATGALAGKAVDAVAAGGAHSLALCSDGTVAAWGNNGSGQLGNGGTTSGSTPVAVTATGVLAGKTVVAVAAGYSHNLALCADGTVVAWGSNNNGQLGNGSATQSSVPVVVTATGALAGRTVVAVSAGSGYSLALCSDGTVAAWGSNSSGELGNGGRTNSSVPVAVTTTGVLAGKTVASISAGGSHSLAFAAIPLSDDPDLTGLTLATAPLSPLFRPGVRSYAASVPTNNQSITVTATTAHPFASVTVNGAVVPSGTASEPIPLSFGVNTITLTVVSESHEASSTYTLSVLRPPPLTATFSSPLSAVPVSFPAYDATGNTVSVDLGYAPLPGTTLTVIDNTGVGFITGRFSNLAQSQTVDLAFGGVTYPFVANYYGGTGNDLVLEWAERQPTAWGDNAAGQLGDGSVIDHGLPTPLTTTGVLANKSVVALATGDYHSLALCADGTVAAWGYNLFGQLGNNTTTDSLAPVTVMANDALAGKTVVAVAAGAIHSLALCADGTVAAWGANYSGQLGNNSTTSSRTPVAVNRNGILSGRTVVAIAAGDSHSLALCTDGTVAAWGDNYSGQLGNHSTAQGRVPVAVNLTGALADKFVVAIAAGAGHSLALCSDGTVVGWGYNGFGQLGDGGTTDSLVPVAMEQTGTLAGKAVISVSAGGDHSLLLCDDGTMVACGRNDSGQLGNGTTADSSVPVWVSTSAALAGKTVVAIGAGDRHSLALCANGTLAAWGANHSGQLGNDSSTSSSVPVETRTSQLGSGIRFIRLATGSCASHVLAITTLASTTPSPFETWQAAVFTHPDDLNNPAISGELATPANDGITNLMKYALALDPWASGTGFLPTQGTGGGYLTLTYRRNKQASDLTYTVQAGDSLAGGGWAQAITVVEQTDAGDHWVVTVRDNVPIAGHPRRFMRLRVGR